MNKIIIFISCLDITQNAVAPVVFDIYATVVNQSFFTVHFTIGSSTTISKLHTNLIIFDQNQLYSTGFKPYYYRTNFTDISGG